METETRAQLPARALLTYREAVNWIAFRSAVNGDMVDAASYEVKWSIASAANAEPGLLGALRALAGGPPLWRGPDECKPPGYKEAEDAAVSLARKSGRLAPDLAAELESDHLAYVEKASAIDRARTALFDAIVEGRISVAAPPPPDGDYAGIKNPSWGASGIDAPANLLLFGVPKDPQWFRRVDVLRLWPEQPRVRRAANTQHDWAPVRQALLRRFEDDGVPDWSKERGKKADYERWVEEQFPVDQIPTRSHIRKVIDECTREHFANLDRRI